ncbi:MAG: hypothetical protein IJ664_01115 [Clostridia bacterium]|nr:hypothetical protein [Clostridia bacterium]
MKGLRPLHASQSFNNRFGDHLALSEESCAKTFCGRTGWYTLTGNLRQSIGEGLICIVLQKYAARENPPERASSTGGFPFAAITLGVIEG